MRPTGIKKKVKTKSHFIVMLLIMLCKDFVLKPTTLKMHFTNLANKRSTKKTSEFNVKEVLFYTLWEKSTSISCFSLNPIFFSLTHSSPRGHCQEEVGLGRSARQSVLLACMQAVELSSTAR